jgi:acyl dehydratase
MLGATIGDLDAGDVFTPVQYTLTKMMVDVYADGVEEDLAWFHSDATPWHRQVRPPTMIHADKMRLLEENCPDEQRIRGMQSSDGMAGADARIHYEYRATHHQPAFVGDDLVVSGRIADRYERRGRTYLLYELEVRKADGQLVTSYTDRTVLRFRKEGEA